MFDKNTGGGYDSNSNLKCVSKPIYRPRLTMAVNSAHD